MAITDDDLRGLSAAERESLLAVDDDDEDMLSEFGHSIESDDEEEAPKTNDSTEDPPETVGTTEDVQHVDEDPEPLQQARATPQDASEQRTALRAEQAAALQKLMDGEITPEDYATKNNEAQDKLEALVRAEASDMTRETIIRDAMMKDYSAEVATVQKAIRAAGLDMKANDGAIGGEFDRVVRMFAQEATARGLVDVPGNLAASKAALQEAQDYMLRRHGKATPAPAAAPAAPQARKPAHPDRSQFPPTLANVPAAADATIVNEFAHLENLEGSALERALARLTPDQQERYLG
jgi:hypothetical protein